MPGHAQQIKSHTSIERPDAASLVPRNDARERTSMTSILFGSISTLADTSEHQRQAFNDAFAAHGLDWNWDRDTYQTLLEESGGASRVAAYAAEAGEDVDAAAVHRTKSELFQQRLASGAVSARPGVADVIHAAKDKGWKVGLVTTTAAANVTALLDAIKNDVDTDDFDIVVSSDDVDASKPDPEVYTWTLGRLDEDAARTVAIEDNVGGVAAAKAAGVTCIAFPNQNTAGHDFATADMRLDTLEVSAVVEAAAG
jgi:HAD superfamily hydrolase (TIGR01509 family)